MVKWLTHNEVLEILREFPASNCNRFELTMGSIHIVLNRTQETSNIGTDNTTVETVPTGEIVPIVSPSVGIFCTAPEGAQPFAQPGDRVREDTVIGLIRVLQEIKWVKAEVGGTIIDICAKDNQFVEFGQLLLHILTDGGVKI